MTYCSTPLSQRAGVIFERAPNEFQFAHLSFQEHLAACYWARPEHYPASAVQDLAARPGAWRNVVDLLPDELARRQQDLSPLLRALLPGDVVYPVERDDPSWQRVLFAARMLQRMPDDDDRLNAFQSRLRTALVSLVEAGTLGAKERAEMGRILSQLGDLRPGTGLIEMGGKMLPDIDWVEIPGVRGWRMIDDAGKEYGPCDIASFRLAKYPVTYRQFQAFVDDPEGWPNRRWWEGLDVDEHHRATPGEQAFKFDNHPRERVSWWDATAFCAWFSIRLSYEQTLYEWSIAGKDWRKYPGVRLPAEWEWQTASQGAGRTKVPL